MIGPIDTPHEFIYVPDVGSVLLDLAARPEAYGRWWHLGGPGTITQREFATKVFAAAGKTPKLRVAGKGTLRVMGLFNPLMRELVEMNYLQTHPVVLDDSALQKLLGPVKKTSYDEGIVKTLEAMRSEAVAKPPSVPVVRASVEGRRSRCRPRTSTGRRPTCATRSPPFHGAPSACRPGHSRWSCCAPSRRPHRHGDRR